MLKQIKVCGSFVTGASLGGLLVGLLEALYRDVSWAYGMLLYGALFAAGAACAVVLASTIYRGAIPRHLGTWGMSLSVSAASLIMVRFIILRDFLEESLDQRWQATVVAAGCAAAAFIVIQSIGRIAQRSADRAQTPRESLSWIFAMLVCGAFAFLAIASPHTPPTADIAGAEQLEGHGVILVVADALRADVLGAYGADQHNNEPPSPSFDSMARNGMLFENSSAQASWTKPAMASIMTSRHASGHGTMSKAAVLPATLPTLASTLQAAGIKTGAVVTNYNLEESFGFARGFDDYLYLGPDRYLGAPPRANRLVAYNIYRLIREKLFARAREPGFFYQPAQEVTRRGLEILDRVGNQPFFLWLHYMEPHDPYFAVDGGSFARVASPNPPAHRAPLMLAAYRDDVKRFDTALGDLRSELSDRGLDGRVTIVVTADHGEEFAEHGGFYHGVTLYEEQLHIPLAIAGAGLKPSLRTDVAQQIDIAPTIAGLLDVSPPHSWEGRNLLVSHTAPEFAIAEENHQGNQLKSIRATSGQHHKLVLANQDNPRGLETTELYTLEHDPREERPITNQSQLVESLTNALDAIREQSRHGGAVAADRELDDAAEAELRSLGYIQ